MTFVKGTLWQSIVNTTEHALREGALLPVPTNYTFVEDGGMRFLVRVLAGLTRKDEARERQDAASKREKNANPFLPPEKDLTVADVSDTHIAILNKFNVVEHHVLIITRDFEDQDTLLTLKDFEALWLCLDEYNGIAFYNGGREAGASQQHKHLQIAPLPLAPEGPPLPVEPLIAEASGKCEEAVAIPGFPFFHSFVRLRGELIKSPYKAAQVTFDLYSSMLDRVGMPALAAHGPARQSMPYCLLITREWMLLVPRSREFFEGISFNALAFAGSLFVRNERQLEQLKAFGPMNALRSVTIPR